MSIGRRSTRPIGWHPCESQVSTWVRLQPDLGIPTTTAKYHSWRLPTIRPSPYVCRRWLGRDIRRLRTLRRSCRSPEGHHHHRSQYTNWRRTNCSHRQANRIMSSPGPATHCRSGGAGGGTGRRERGHRPRLQGRHAAVQTTPTSKPRMAVTSSAPRQVSTKALTVAALPVLLQRPDDIGQMDLEAFAR